MKDALLAPMKIVRVPSFAPSVPPVTGASIYSIFLLASRAEKNLALEGLIVDKSTTIVPSVRPVSYTHLTLKTKREV